MTTPDVEPDEAPTPQEASPPLEEPTGTAEAPSWQPGAVA